MSTRATLPSQSFDSVDEIRERFEGKRPRRRYFLIVCEGERTEPNYFDSIRRMLPREMADRITVKGQGYSTLRLVDAACNKNKERLSSDNPPYYHIWIVFDKDSFQDDDFDNAINRISALDSAPKSRHSHHQRWHAAWSNEAFELWYILHFQETTGGALSRNVYQQMLEKHIKDQCGVDRPYRKNADDMFPLLMRYTPQAIERAKNALRRQARKPPHAQNPATMVHLLVEELLRYL